LDTIKVLYSQIICGGHKEYNASYDQNLVGSESTGVA